MKLYHGSNTEINNIEINKSRKYKDFGTGFYLTTNLDQAIEQAIQASYRDGGEPIVTTFIFNDTDAFDLKIKKFDEVSIEWAKFIINNRTSLSNFINYDIISGPIPDDYILTYINLFINDTIDEDYLIKKLKHKKLNNQYLFHTNKSLNYLKKLEAKTYCKTLEQDIIITNLIETIINSIVKDYNISIKEALEMYFKTNLSSQIDDIKNAYYKESAASLYESIKEEIN